MNRTFAGSCPECGAIMNAHVAVSTKAIADAQPNENSVTICCDCATPLVFLKHDDGLRLARCMVDLLPDEDRRNILKVQREVAREIEERKNA